MVPAWAGLSKFGEVVTADHFDCLAERKNSVMGHTWGLVMVDLHSGYLMSRAVMTNSAVETGDRFRHWRGRDRVIHMHSDGSGELNGVCRYEGITHSIIETGDHAANGIAEGHVRLPNLGAATLLAQAGLTKHY